MNIIQKIEADELARVSENRRMDDFDAGDTVKVNVRIVEGNNERIQAFEGVCIAKKDRGIHSSFTVRKLSHGEGVERIFPLYGPRVDSVELIRRGDVRRAKLYYLRGLTGKAARIKEKTDFGKVDQSEKQSKTAKAAANRVAKAERKAAAEEARKADAAAKAEAEKAAKAAAEAEAKAAEENATSEE